MKGKIFCAYFFGLLGGAVIYLTEKENLLVRFHAMQSILFSVFIFFTAIVAEILGGIFGTEIFSSLVSIVVLIGCVLGIVKGFSGEFFKFPIVGDKAYEIVNK